MRRLVTALVLAGTLAALAPKAEAFPAWMQEGKAGRFMFNLKFGPAITAKNGIDVGYKIVPFALVLDFGFAVDAKRQAYILFSLQFQLHDQVNAVIIPFGFQYDIPIHQVPGLYITPRAMLGYAAIIPNFPGVDTINTAFLEFAGGAKFIFKQRWNVGFEPVSVAVFIGDQNGVTYSGVSYRLLWYGGVNF